MMITLLLTILCPASPARADDEITFVAMGGTIIMVDCAFTAGALMGPHSRTYGFIEAGLHAPIAFFDLYAAGKTGNGLVGGVLYVAAGWSAALALHGAWSILRGDGHAVTASRGTVITPTLLADGGRGAPGLGVLGRF